MSRAALPPLPLAEWEDTKLTLHLFLQIVGKVRMALMPPQNHWWHVPLYVSTRGFTTRPVPLNGGAFEIQFDLASHDLEIATTAGRVRRFSLLGISVADFYEKLFTALHDLGITVAIRAVPYELPFDTPFPKDREHADYDPKYVQRFWEILVWTSGVLSRFAGRFVGKTSPVHLFWHSFDLAVTRFSGRPAPIEGGNQVGREAYSHEAVSFGFWAGDETVREPMFYSYTYPEPPGLREQPLEPSSATWAERASGSLALYPYDAARAAPDPRAALLAFLESAYRAGGRLAGWDLEALRHPRWG
jgi:hypothetical protein